MPNRSEQELDWDKENGVIRFLGDRFWLAKKEEFVSLQKVLATLMGKAAGGVVYQEGVQTADAYLSLFDRQRPPEVQSPADRLEFYLGWLRKLGFGNFRVLEFDVPNATCRVRVADSMAAAAYGKSREPVCNLYAGIIGRIVGKLLGQEAFCGERTCRAAGADFCEFEVFPTAVDRLLAQRGETGPRP